MCDVLEMGDRVIVDVITGAVCDDDGIKSGGRWEAVEGVIYHVYGGSYSNDLTGIMRSKTGRIATFSLIVGDQNGYPACNARPCNA